MIAYREYDNSDIYAGMVAGNVLYAAFLCAFLCNVMPIDEKRRRYDRVPAIESADSDRSEHNDRNVAV